MKETRRCRRKRTGPDKVAKGERRKEEKEAGKWGEKGREGGGTGERASEEGRMEWASCARRSTVLSAQIRG
eukprot:510053-Pleurochrysis_carterae.AAC.3